MNIKKKSPRVREGLATQGEGQGHFCNSIRLPRGSNLEAAAQIKINLSVFRTISVMCVEGLKVLTLVSLKGSDLVESAALSSSLGRDICRDTIRAFPRAQGPLRSSDTRALDVWICFQQEGKTKIEGSSWLRGRTI